MKAASFYIGVQVHLQWLADCFKKENALNKHKFTKFGYFQGRDQELLTAALILYCQNST